MLDIFNIPGQQDNIKIFYARGTTDWQTWNKPRNCKFIWIMCIGGGAGGAGAGISISAPAGGSGGVCRVLYPANVLPDTLFIQPGPGSIGASGSTTATNNQSNAANRSFVVINPSGSVSATMNTVCISGAAGAGTTFSQTAETAATTTQAGLLSLGSFTATAGQAGDNTISNITPLSSTITCGGAAGGNASAGANVLSVNLGTYSTPQILGGSTGGTIGGEGSSGVWYWKPMFGLGGSGGGDGSITGGKGGNGAYGCGGGGGGKGGTTGGAGGNGGGGLVIIATF